MSLRLRCKQFINVLEGEGSRLVDANTKGYSTTLELIHLASREAYRDLGRIASAHVGPPFDGNVVIAEHLAVYYAAWYSWVTLAKSRDRRRPAAERRRWRRAHDRFLMDLEAAVQTGEGEVERILKKRGTI